MFFFVKLDTECKMPDEAWMKNIYKLVNIVKFAFTF